MGSDSFLRSSRFTFSSFHVVITFHPIERGRRGALCLPQSPSVSLSESMEESKDEIPPHESSSRRGSSGAKDDDIKEEETQELNKEEIFEEYKVVFNCFCLVVRLQLFDFQTPFLFSRDRFDVSASEKIVSTQRCFLNNSLITFYYLVFVYPLFCLLFFFISFMIFHSSKTVISN